MGSSLGAPPQPHCPGAPYGPDYTIPSAKSQLTEDEVVSYASMVAMYRSSWWPGGALSEMDAFTLNLLTNDEVIRITMASTRNRQVMDAASDSFNGTGVVWTADDSMEPGWKYVMLVNMGAQHTQPVAVTFVQLGIPPAASCSVRDLWKGAVLPQRAAVELRATLEPHASLLAKLSDCT